MAYDDREQYYSGGGSLISDPKQRAQATTTMTTSRGNNGQLSISGRGTDLLEQQSTAPTSVASVNNAVAETQKQPTMQRIGYNVNQEPPGLRAVLAPYQSRGNFRNLSSDEKNKMQMQYRDIASMRGLSNRQRQQGLLQMKNRMAEYGMKPTFDLSSEKGLSQYQIMQNRINDGVIDRATLDRQQAIAGANALHNYNVARFYEDRGQRQRDMDEYLNSLWG